MDRTEFLKGKTVTAIHFAKDKLAIKFDVEGGESIVAKVDGDCCSSTWIENVDGAEFLVGQEVLSEEDVLMPKASEKNDDYEVIAFYGYEVKSARGRMLIDYRNSSNGYYGGNLSWPGEYYYGGVHGQNASDLEWEKIA